MVICENIPIFATNTNKEKNMKIYLKASLLLMGFLFTQTTIASAQCPIKEQIMNSGEDDNKQEQAKPADPTTRTLIIFYDKAKGYKPLLKAIKQNNCTLTYKYKEFNGVAIKVRDDWDIDKAIAYFKGVKGVLSVGKNGVMQLQ